MYQSKTFFLSFDIILCDGIVEKFSNRRPPSSNLMRDLTRRSSMCMCCICTNTDARICTRNGEKLCSLLFAIPQELNIIFSHTVSGIALSNIPFEACSRFAYIFAFFAHETICVLSSIMQCRNFKEPIQ